MTKVHITGTKGSFIWIVN